MKRFSCVLLLLVLSQGVCHALPLEIDSFLLKIRAELTESEWEVATDFFSITLTKKGVQFLNPISVGTTPQAWRRYSFTADYRITITFDTRLTQAEYEKLLRVKQELVAHRIQGLSTNTKDYWSARTQADRTIRLPSYYSERFSVYVYTSDDDLFLVRPDSVRAARDTVFAILEKSCAKYTVTSEPNGPANLSQPVGAETNKTSSAAGSGR